VWYVPLQCIAVQCIALQCSAVKVQCSRLCIASRSTYSLSLRSAIVIVVVAQSPLAPNSPWRGAAVLALGVREATVHRSLLSSMARASQAMAPSSQPQQAGGGPKLLNSASVKLALLQAIVEDSLMRGDAAGAAAVLFHAMDASEEQSRAGAEE
jgi:hypothetical protein